MTAHKLGPQARAIADALDGALSYAGRTPSMYLHFIAEHTEHGVGLLLSQSPLTRSELSSADPADLVLVCEAGIVGDCGDGTTLCLTPDQPAASLAALLTAAILTDSPIDFPVCAQCAAEV
jgi:hypothetical protein